MPNATQVRNVVNEVAESISTRTRELSAQAQALQRELAKFKPVNYDSAVKLSSCKETKAGAEVDEIVPEFRAVLTVAGENMKYSP